MRASAPLITIALAGCDLVFPLSPRASDSGNVADDANDACDVMFQTIPRLSTTSRYHVVANLPAGWLAAELLCERNHPNTSHLFVPDDLTELETIQQELQRVGASPAWIGVARNVTANPDKAGFTTVIGDPAPDLWRIGEPENGSGQEYAVFITATDGFVDEDADRAKSFVCECDGRNPIDFNF